MNAKITNSNKIKQGFPAGVALNDHNIEFVGNPTTKTVIWMRCGNGHSFNVLPKNIFSAINKLLLSDHSAIDVLSQNYPEAINDVNRMVELYTYYMYGQLNSRADVIKEELQQCDNLRDNANCISLSFKHKSIKIGTYALTSRDLQIIDDVYNGLPNKVTAHKLEISQSTLDFHKRNLFKQIGATHQTDALKLAFQNDVVC